MAFTFTIATVAKSLQPGWRVTETLNGRNVMTFSVLSLDGTYRPASRAVVAFAEDATTLFAGTIQEKSEQGLGGYGVTPIDTQCGAVDFNELPDRRQVEVTIPAGSTLKQALTQVVAYLSPYGVSLDAGQVDGPTFTDALVFEFGPLTAVLNKLSVISGYAWEIDYTKNLRMFVPGVTAAAFNIAADDGHVIGDISVSPSLSDFANQVIVRFTESARAAYAFLSASGNFTDGETVTVGSKTYTFQDTLTDSNGNVQIGASAAVSLEHLAAAITLDAGAGTAYAASMTVNGSVTAFMQSATLMAARSLSVGASGNSIGCTTTASDAAWITEGGGGTTTLLFGADDALTNTVTATTSPAAGDLVELVFAHPEIRDQATAQAMADGYLVRALVEPREIRYKTLTPGLRPGHKQNIVEARRGLNGDCLITAIDTYAVGNVLWYDVTATDSLVIPSDYKDTFRAWNGGGSGANVSAMLSGGGGGTISGVGTVGKIAKWSGAESLTDSIITESGSALTVAGSVEATAMTIAGAYVYRAGGTDVSLADGGTNASLTAVNGGLIYSTSSAMAVGAAGATGQIVRSGGAGAPTWSTATYPATATTAGAYLRADGTNWITSTLVLPNAATVNRIPYATATNTWGEGAGLTYNGSAFGVTGTGTFSGRVIASAGVRVPNGATNAGHYFLDSGGVERLTLVLANASLSGTGDILHVRNVAAQPIYFWTNNTVNAQLSSAGAWSNTGTLAFGGGMVLDSSTKVVMTDTTQTISGAKTFSNAFVVSTASAVAASITNTDTTNGYGLAINAGGTSAMRYALNICNPAASVSYGGVTTTTGQVGRWAIGFAPTGTVSARLHVRDTTEQFRVDYDVSNYFSTTVGSTGGVTFDAVGAGAAFTFSDQVNIATHLRPTINWTSDLGSQTLKVRKIYAAELEVDTLVAQDVIATIGGEILTAPTTKLTAALTDSATTISVEHNELASGDRIWLEARGQFEMMAVTSGPSGSGPYTYSVTRNLDTSGANAWLAGDAVVNTGTTGDGYIHQYATGGRFGGTGPTIVGQVRTGTDYNAIATRWAIGNLNGLYGYVADIYGAAFGDPSNAWLKIDATNGIRIGHDATTKISLTAAGDASFTGSVTAAAGAIGGFNIGATTLSASSLTLTSGTFNVAHIAVGGGLSTTAGLNAIETSSDIAIWAGDTHANRATAVFRVTGAGALTATSATITGNITATTGTFGGTWQVNTNRISYDTGTDATSAGMAPLDFPFFAGATYTNRASAPFRVTPAGALTATSATITGNITATSGTITGDFTIGTSGLLRSGATDYTTGTGWVLDYNAGTPRFRVGTTAGNRFAWDGTDLTLVSGGLSIGASGISLGITTSIDATRMFRFDASGSVTGSNIGLYAVQDSLSKSRSLVLTDIVTSASSTSQVQVRVECVTANPASIALISSDATSVFSTIGLVADSVEIQGRAVLSSEISPTSLGANTDNWNPAGLSAARCIRVSASAAYDLTGIVAQQDGTEIFLLNVGANAITLKHDVTSTAANRFFLAGGLDVNLNQYRGLLLRYDGTMDRWVVAL